MTAAARKSGANQFAPNTGRVDLLDCFVARADARALLWHAAIYELAEAVDVLQRDAERDGLVERIGQDAVQAILADAFRPFYDKQQQADAFDGRTYGFDRRNDTDQQQVVNSYSRREYAKFPEQTKRRTFQLAGNPLHSRCELRARPTPESTIEAILYCVRQRGIDALKEPANKERLARCDDAAQPEIKRRIAKLRDHVMAPNKSSRGQA